MLTKNHQYSKKPHIYKLTDTRNGKIYIGKRTPTLYRKKDDYFTGGKIPKNIIKQHSKDVFKKEIIKQGNYTTQELNDLEIFYIAVFRSNHPEYGYNLTKGGDGANGYKQTKEHKEKIRQANIGLKRSKDVRDRLSNLKIGNKLSKEHRDKISESHKGSKNHFYGKRHSEESRNKISKANSGVNSINFGKPRDEATKNKISIAHKGKTLSIETKEKIRQSKIGKHKGENNPNYGNRLSDETKKRISESLKNIPKVECKYCCRNISPNHYKTYHGDKCKQKPLC